MDGRSSDRDVWLARRASLGHRDAQRQVRRRTVPVMLRVVRRVLGPGSPDEEDVLQEASYALLGALAAYRGECSLRHYAGRIAARHAVRARRRRERERGKVVALRRHRPGVPTDGSPDASRGSEAVADEARLRALLGAIPAEQAEALVLRVVAGCTLPEIAEAMGVPVNTVRSRIRLARERLRRMLQEESGRVSSR